MNQFGGTWTEAKMEIVVSYARAYLTIMNKQSWVKTLYFDGFAGSGLINSGEESEAKKGTALRILDIEEPKPFDIYYFVELNEEYKKELEKIVNTNYSVKDVHVVREDCNKKIIAMAKFLTKNKDFRALAFIDPYGMAVNWKSIESMKGLGVDLWILVPTGLGVNRLLKNNGDISEAWLTKLENFLGIPKDEIKDHFYKTKVQNTLFGAEMNLEKEKDAIGKIGELYKKKLNEMFNYVSDSFIMRNNKNAIMYHFMMATNNTAALKIANDVIKPKYKI